MLKMDRSQDPDFLAAMGMEIHGISSSGKPLTSWTAQAACQEGREACGGHGFLKCSRFGEIRADNDANCTYEGKLLKLAKMLEYCKCKSFQATTTSYCSRRPTGS